MVSTTTAEKDIKMVVPTKEHISEALRLRDPEKEAKQQHKDAIKFLIETAIPAVAPKVLRDREWVRNKTTHVEFFGDSWVFEMATAVLLIDKFSDTGNLKYNLGITDERGNTLPSKIVPDKKRRKKMHTKTEEKRLQQSYYHLCKFFQTIKGSDGFEDRMKYWDGLFCGDRGRECDEDQLASRTNTVPSIFREQEGAENDEGMIQEFLKSSKFSSIWGSMPSLVDSPDASTGSAATDQSTPLLVTQPDSSPTADAASTTLTSI